MPKVLREVRNEVQGFRQFIGQYGVLPLAIGVVIGNAVNDVVRAIVADIVTPLISLLAPTTKLQNLQFDIGQSTFKIGEVLNAVISFLVIAWIVYLAVKFLLRNNELLKKS